MSDAINGIVLGVGAPNRAADGRAVQCGIVLADDHGLCRIYADYGGAMSRISVWDKVAIDRSTRYGNPFVMNEDGDRDDVCDAYERHYLPRKPSITDRIEAGELTGKVLVCHCYPQRCHGDCLAAEANSISVK